MTPTRRRARAVRRGDPAGEEKQDGQQRAARGDAVMVKAARAEFELE